MTLVPPPLTLYVHIPWCVRKCPYCDFNSHAHDGPLPEAAYFEALVRQLEATLPRIWGRRIQAIFFGGGTPSLVSPEVLAQFLSVVRALLGVDGRIEITLEANPGTSEAARFADYRAAGINRLSIGVQSFHDVHLQALGRIHDAREAAAAVEAAQVAGFDNFNIDLMFGLPGQTVAEAIADVERALAFEPPHLSHYQLTLEPNTPFYRRPPPALPDEDRLDEMQQICAERLRMAGLGQYEVSAWARPGFQCRHNLNYWQYGDYVGLGAGAHGKLTDGATGEIWRSRMPASPGAYMEAMRRGAPGRWWRVSPEERPFEFMLNRLRLRQPFTLSEFEAVTGCSREQVLPRLREAAQAAMLTIEDDEKIELTDQGFRFVDSLVSAFLPSAS